MTVATPTAERASAVAAVVAAFANDPILRWIYPDPARYLSAFPDVIELIAGSAFDTGTVEIAAEGRRGAALWLSPGAEADEDALGELVAATVDADRHDDVFGLLAQMDEQHPERDLWYLPFVGVDPPHQGHGLGSTLLAGGLSQADRDGVEAYLEASTPANRRLYERHGFEVVGEIRSGDSPPMWPMLRPPADHVTGLTAAERSRS